MAFGLLFSHQVLVFLAEGKMKLGARR